ncbi:MAG: hypothetical protein KAG66_09215 [Methylococcales bacterium]|nr:hypothetical protein [Methylococcales bacterium]
MSLGVIAGTVAIGAIGAYGQYEENKANKKADKANKADAERGYQRSVGHQQQANNFAIAQYAPYMRGGANAWNAMQQGMSGDGAYNNYDPNAKQPFYGLTEGQSGIQGGYIPGANPGQPGGGPNISSPNTGQYTDALAGLSGIGGSQTMTNLANAGVNTSNGQTSGSSIGMMGENVFKRPEYLEESNEDIARRRGGFF